MEKVVEDLKALTVKDLVAILRTVDGRVPVFQATDEEGNSYSPITVRGIAREGDRIVFYPILVDYN